MSVSNKKVRMIFHCICFIRGKIMRLINSSEYIQRKKEKGKYSTLRFGLLLQRAYLL